MPTYRTLIVVLLGFLTNQPCYAANNEVSMYVLVQAEKTEVFTLELASIVERLGLVAQLGNITDDKGNTLYGLEASGREIRVWSHNTYVTTRADPEQCGEVDESYPDPGQYIVDVQTNSSTVSESSVVELIGNIEDGLTDLGYEVRDEPVVCSPLAKTARREK